MHTHTHTPLIQRATFARSFHSTSTRWLKHTPWEMDVSTRIRLTFNLLYLKTLTDPKCIERIKLRSSFISIALPTRCWRQTPTTLVQVEMNRNTRNTKSEMKNEPKSNKPTEFQTKRTQCYPYKFLFICNQILCANILCAKACLHLIAFLVSIFRGFLPNVIGRNGICTFVRSRKHREREKGREWEWIERITTLEIISPWNLSAIGTEEKRPLH